MHEDISLILVHCLRESVGGHCWGLWELKLMLCETEIATPEIRRDLIQQLL